MLPLILRKSLIIANYSPRLPTPVIVYTIYFLLKALNTVLTVLGKENTITTYQLPNVEFSLYKNCFINQCLFKYR